MYITSHSSLTMGQLQAKVNDRGIACLAYNVLLRSGVTFGVGVSLDTQKLNESAHKVCRVLWQSKGN